ncbi:hypothetical protein BS78_05G148500 [Paspalum vaginatum]|nr:hypothetical protein BS78_05G148500 [Paspalum vaginatum]
MSEATAGQARRGAHPANPLCFSSLTRFDSTTLRRLSNFLPSTTDARQPFNAMPPGIRGGKRKRAAPPGAGRCSIDALPDDALHHVLSFLPAQEAVRTCVLAQRWHHLWRSATGLRISCGYDHDEAASVKELRKIVDNLLRLRRGSPLDTCVLDLLGVDSDDIDGVNLWIRRVLTCNV